MTLHDALAADGDAQVMGRLLATRHSCRGFLPQALPRETIEQVLAMASRTPSWCNTQPWHVNVVSGPTLDTLRERYTARIRAGKRAPDLPFPNAYRGRFLERRRECGRALYQSLDIGREDRERAHDVALLRVLRDRDQLRSVVVAAELADGVHVRGAHELLGLLLELRNQIRQHGAIAHHAERDRGAVQQLDVHLLQHQLLELLGGRLVAEHAECERDIGAEHGIVDVVERGA